MGIKPDIHGPQIRDPWAFKQRAMAPKVKNPGPHEWPALKKRNSQKIETPAPNNKLTAAEINTLCIHLTQNSSYELSY